MITSACATVPPSGDSLSAIADDYVLLQLTIGEKEAGYIDAYYGDPALMARAKAEGTAATLDGLAERVAALEVRTAKFAQDGNASTTLEERRARFLAAQLTA